jgi:hypothetical protein
MSGFLKQFGAYKFDTEFFEGYCKHTTGSTAQKWNKGRVLGRGSGGIVWLEKGDKGEVRAVKQIYRSTISGCSQELLALAELKTVYIVL